ncbi:MAG: 23S rRNA (adenine(2503)-C(2))-methyltransferase RlmN [Candidatus Kerfeldbacteria bacterium CG_4_10_14_0_8_um_filter_42_10]|uniref:Probable dual-specificity RNA methyltransferase RlmN n=1 Tax=Candidatus Kerfeldbacteria bacterium CG_4_10_14_0_8_um_filter_42_10 TaxID=2014248 RepID=A0A2M7RK63_9BACT|nr:MAG: 23S rRNA (adenine(2503)-C(2))-methyltransferase RlmN [Candidatus Kerfeldbacteria bacterium CG_4_10_14_0_8_um_filter_42_10]
MNLNNLEKTLNPYPSFRLKQAKEAVYVNLIDNWNKASNLPKELRGALNQECPLDIKAEIIESKDKQTAKALVYFVDGFAVETVLMRHKDGRNTVCVSSQIGCPLACAFCATGEQKLTRNLSAAEITEQVILWARKLKQKNNRVDGVVFMGMGEPFLNYDEVLKAIRVLNSQEGLNIGARHISISTSGLTEGIAKLAKESLQVNLAISLHAPNNQLRAILMPINRKYNVEKVLAAVKNYIAETRRRVMVEYLMLGGLNDSEKEAQELASVLKQGLEKLFFVNLISYNSTGKFKPSTQATIDRFKLILEKEKISVVQRFRFGRDIEGACGQLKGRKMA